KQLGNTLNFYKSNKKGFYNQININHHFSGDVHTPGYNLDNTSFKNSFAGFVIGNRKFKKGWEIDFSALQSTNGILSYAHIGNTTDLARIINRDSPLVTKDFDYQIEAPKQAISHYALKSQYFYRLKGMGKMRWNYSFQQNQREEFDNRRGDLKNTPVIDLTLKTHQLQWHWDLDQFKDKKFQIGISTQLQNNFPDPSTGVKRLIPDYDKFDIGTYFIAKHEISKSFVFDYGIRFDYSKIEAQKFYTKTDWDTNFNDQYSRFLINYQGSQAYTEPTLQYNNLSFQTGFWWAMNSKSDIRVNGGYNSRNPNPAELFSDGIHQSSASFEFGNLGLEKEQNLFLSTEFAYHTAKLDIEIQPYVKYIQDYIYLAPKGLKLSIRGAFLNYNYQQTDALVSGTDINLNYFINEKLSISNKIAFVNGKDISNNTSLINFPPMNGNLELAYNINKNWNFKGNMEWYTQQTNVPDLNFYATIDNQQTLIDISTAPKGYQLFNLNTSYKLNISKKQQIVFIGEVENLANTTYRSYLNRLRYFADETGRSFNIKINYTF
ncbi:TonB-dependent receptor, partial [Flavobacteriaceae bacterium]|nr:TonB-dependent receptor [Flavobacteriaceae bacterium]